VPVYNEEENIQELYNEVTKAMSNQACVWELVFVDDGSSDRSLDIIRSLSDKDECVRYVSFARNCGQSAAFAAGFRCARGDAVVTLDADLQNDPADIPAMLRVFEGVDMVIGWRAKRQDSFVKRHASRVANWIRNVIRKIPMFTGMHRFLPTLMKLEGARVAEVRVNHRPRTRGISKYGIWDRALASAYDLLAVRWMKKRHICCDIATTNMR
jgi:glycosyltransferase involved in cell wall biosynthesis